MESSRPAWSEIFSPERLGTAFDPLPSGGISSEWAWGGATGKGVRVAVVDSGIENSHPAVAGRVKTFAAFTADKDGKIEADLEPHDDSFGHGTACADAILRLAPEAELASVRVLGQFLRGKGPVFAAGLRWAIEQGYQVVNLSLGTTQKDYAGLFHELADLAYFKGTVLVTAANNMQQESFPSLYASVLSVASHHGLAPYDPYEYYYNPAPPPEFGAWGMNVRLAWIGGSYLEVTGNSFAAPHIAGLAARILSKHSELRPFHLKSVLAALARNARRR